MVPLWHRNTESTAFDVRRYPWQREDEGSSLCELSVCDGPHTQDCVQLLCGHRAACQRYGSLYDRSQQQQHADSHVGSSHLQGEVGWHVQIINSSDIRT